MDMSVQFPRGNIMQIPTCNEAECIYFTIWAKQTCIRCEARHEAEQEQLDNDEFEQTDGPESDYQECSRRDCSNEVFDPNYSICRECENRLEADHNRIKANYYRLALISILHTIGPKQDDNTDDWIDDLVPTITAISQDAIYWRSKYMDLAHPDRIDEIEIVID